MAKLEAVADFIADSKFILTCYSILLAMLFFRWTTLRQHAGCKAG